MTNVTATHSKHLLPASAHPDTAAAAAADDDDDDDAVSGMVRYDSGRGWRRGREDDTLYVILGVIVGAVLIGVLVTLFVCARRQHKQRLLLGTAHQRC